MKDFRIFFSLPSVVFWCKPVGSGSGESLGSGGAPFLCASSRCLVLTLRARGMAVRENEEVITVLAIFN